MEHEGYPARFAMTSVVYEDGKLPGYEGQLISGMALTSRIQATRLVADGSTFRTVDTDAVVTTTDRSFRPVDTAVGPDGAVYFADWCDIRMDHTDPRDTWDKSCGRIWRLRAKDYRPVAPFNLAQRSSQELIELLGDTEKVVPRAGTTSCSASAKTSRSFPQLRRLARDERGQLALEALWTANLISGMDAEWALDLLDHPDAPVRSWALRLLNHAGSIARPHAAEAGQTGSQRAGCRGAERARGHGRAPRGGRRTGGAARADPPAGGRLGQTYSAANLVGPREQDHQRRGSSS